LIDNYDHEIYRFSMFRGALSESSGDRMTAQLRAKQTADGVLGISSAERKKIDSLCHGTSSERANAVIVDTAVGLGVFHTHGRYCPNWMAPFLCEFYERQFCYMYSSLPSWDTDKGKYVPEAVGAKDHNTGSNAFLSHKERRTHGGLISKKMADHKPLVTVEMLRPTEGDSPCEVGTPLRVYVESLINRYNSGVAPLLSGSKPDLMSRLANDYDTMWKQASSLKTVYSHTYGERHGNTRIVRGEAVPADQYPQLFAGLPCNDESCRYTPARIYRPHTFPPGLLHSPDFTEMQNNRYSDGNRMYCQLLSDVDTSRDTASIADEVDSTDGSDQEVIQMTFYYGCSKSAVVRAAAAQQWESRGMHFKSPLLDEIRGHIMRVYALLDNELCVGNTDRAGRAAVGTHDDGLAELIYNGPHVLKFIYCLVRAQQAQNGMCQLPDLDSTETFVGKANGVSSTSGANDNLQLVAPTCAMIFQRENPSTREEDYARAPMDFLPFFGPRQNSGNETNPQTFGHKSSIYLKRHSGITHYYGVFQSRDASQTARHFEFGEIVNKDSNKHHLYKDVAFSRQMHVQLANNRMDPPIGITEDTITTSLSEIDDSRDSTQTSTGVQRGENVVENMCARFVGNLKDTNNWHAGTDWLVGLYSVPISPYKDKSTNTWLSTHNIGETMKGDGGTNVGFKDYTERSVGAYKGGEGLICLSYRVDYGNDDTETCVHVNDNTTCNSFAKNQQAVESAGVFDVTNTDCICDSDVCDGATIKLEDYDPTIGCPSQHWTTVYPRDSEGVELPQCCTDCEMEAIGIRDAMSCVSDWAKCGVSMKSLFADVMCDGAKGGIISAITKAVHSVQQLIKLMPSSTHAMADQHDGQAGRTPVKNTDALRALYLTLS
jgi:hypothetical protein